MAKTTTNAVVDSPAPVPTAPSGPALGRRMRTGADKDAAFRKYAARRVNKALNALKAVGRLGNRRSYSYSAEHAAMILKAVGAAYDDLRRAFSDAPVADTGFRLE